MFLSLLCLNIKKKSINVCILYNFKIKKGNTSFPVNLIKQIMTKSKRKKKTDQVKLYAIKL